MRATRWSASGSAHGHAPRPAGTTAQQLRLVRFGDNMRDVAVTEGDKVEAQLRLGVSVNTYSVNDLVAEVEGASAATVDAIVADYEASYSVVPELATGGARHESLRYAASIEAGLRSFLDAGKFTAFTTNFEDLGGIATATRHRGAAPHGRWLRLRRRGRLEDLGARADPEGHGPGPERWHLVHGGLHLPSRSRRAEGSRCAHAGGLPDHRGRDAEL